MSRTKIKSPIKHPKVYFAQFREYYFDMCDGNIRAALVLDYLEYTHAMRLAKIKDAKRYKRVQPSNYQFQTNLNISIQLRMSESEVVKIIRLLKDKGFITVWDYNTHYVQKGEKRYGLSPENYIDKKRWLLFNEKFVQEQIDIWAEEHPHKVKDDSDLPQVVSSDDDSDENVSAEIGDEFSESFIPF